MSADTQETVRETKNYTEKIEILDDLSYPLAVGGAGFDDMIKPITQEIIARGASSKPATKAELKKVIDESVKFVFEHDVPILAIKKQHRAPQFLIAAKPTNDDFCIFPVIGRRTYKEVRRAIIGYPNAYNYALLERLHTDDLPMQQAVMLAIYLVSQSKKFDEGVGGDSQIVVVRDNGAWIDDAEYVKQFDIFIGEFLKLIDRLFLNCVDVSIPPSSVFPEKLKEFSEQVTQLRYSALVYSAAHYLNRALHDPNCRGEPYPKVFPGAVTSVMGDGTIQVSEEPKEQREERLAMMQAAEEQINESRAASAELAPLIAGRKPIFVFKFVATLQPNNSANLTSVQSSQSSEPTGNTKASPGACVADKKGQQ